MVCPRGILRWKNVRQKIVWLGIVQIPNKLITSTESHVYRHLHVLNLRDGHNKSARAFKLHISCIAKEYLIIHYIQIFTYDIIFLMTLSYFSVLFQIDGTTMCVLILTRVGKKYFCRKFIYCIHPSTTAHFRCWEICCCGNLTLTFAVIANVPISLTTHSILQVAYCTKFRHFD